MRGGLKANQSKRMKELERENQRLNKLVADLSFEKAILRDVAQRDVWSAPNLQGSWVSRGARSST